MANYKSKYTGEQIDEAVKKALEGGSGGGSASATQGHTLTVTENSQSYEVYFADGTKTYVPSSNSLTTPVEYKNVVAFHIYTDSKIGELFGVYMEAKDNTIMYGAENSGHGNFYGTSKPTFVLLTDCVISLEAVPIGPSN